MRGLPETLRGEIRDEVAILHLARPEKRNALDDTTVDGIRQFYDQLPPGTRAAILTGEGAHFCAGLDLASTTERDACSGLHHSRLWHRAFDAIEFGPVPTIAVLHGACVGGGLELAAAAHIRVAERSTFYALPEGSRGIYVGGGASVRLAALIGVARMMDMMLTGRTYGADEGVALGFSQYLVDDGHGFARAFDLARLAAGNTAMTNFAIIQALPRIARADPQTGLLMESLMSAIVQDTPEAKRRLHDFLDKRAARVAHRPEPDTDGAR